MNKENIEKKLSDVEKMLGILMKEHYELVKQIKTERILKPKLWNFEIYTTDDEKDRLFELIKKNFDNVVVKEIK
jgi:hypothetical protein